MSSTWLLTIHFTRNNFLCKWAIFFSYMEQIAIDVCNTKVTINHVLQMWFCSQNLLIKQRHNESKNNFGEVFQKIFSPHFIIILLPDSASKIRRKFSRHNLLDGNIKKACKSGDANCFIAWRKLETRDMGYVMFAYARILTLSASSKMLHMWQCKLKRM